MFERKHNYLAGQKWPVTSQVVYRNSSKLWISLRLFFFFFSFIILFQKQFFCTQQFTDVWWPTTAIRQNDINLLILDSTLIILY